MENSTIRLHTMQRWFQGKKSTPPSSCKARDPSLPPIHPTVLYTATYSRSTRTWWSSIVNLVQLCILSFRDQLEKKDNIIMTCCSLLLGSWIGLFCFLLHFNSCSHSGRQSSSHVRLFEMSFLITYGHSLQKKSLRTVMNGMGLMGGMWLCTNYCFQMAKRQTFIDPWRSLSV